MYILCCVFLFVCLFLSVCFNKTIIPRALVGYERVIGLIATSYEVPNRESLIVLKSYRTFFTPIPPKSP